MGDRNNPIKFGPEWLRNISRERSAARLNIMNANAGASASASGGSSGGGTSNSASATASSNTNNGQPKVLLAKQRYGREEMLALYDKNAEAPSELKVIDTLYQPRGKQPVALNNTFEDDVRDNLRSAPPIGGMASGDRFVLSRGAGRGASNDGRGRPRGSYIRQPSMGRGSMWHVTGPRMIYSGGQDDESGASGTSRPWTNNNLNNPIRSSGDQTDWTTKMYRNKRPGNNTNWRSSQARDDSEEWRSSEPGRTRQLEKWDRDWGDRQSGERPQSWNNRRNWGGDNQNNEENLPEWAVENAECGGTFDSSGAFHGYSNDDSNLPKHQEGAYSLTRSHTHGSFPRPKVVEEGSDEWWASEKAKKLSPKRFDASDLKVKKQPSIGIAEPSSSSTNNRSNSSNEGELDKMEELSASESEPPEASAAGQGEHKFGKQSAYKSNKFTESKTFDALMRSDIDLEEASDERGNFQSVIINSNNSLRQKHQHLVPAMKEASGKSMHNMKGSMKHNQSDMDHASHKSPEELLVDNIFSMSLDDKEMHSTPSSNSFSNSMSSVLASAASGMPQNQNMQMSSMSSMSNSGIPTHGMNMDMHLNSQNIQTAVIQPVHHSPGMQPVVINAGGMQQGMPSGMQQGMPSSMQAGLHMPNMPVTMQPGMQNTGYSSVAMQNMPGMPSGGMQNMPGMPSGGMQNMPGLQAQRAQTPGMQSGMQNVGITNSALNASLGLPIGPNMGQTYQGMPQQMTNNSSLSSSGMGGMGTPSMQGSGNMPNFPSSGTMPGMPNNSLFLGQNSNNTSMSSASDMPMSNHSGQNIMIQLQGMQGSQGGPFGNSMYGNNAMPNANILDQWYYEDPERNIQGPFSSIDMYNWYRAGFFSPSLMVRRACETIMRPLGTYGPVVPFAHMSQDLMSAFPAMSGGFDRPQGSHDNMMNAQANLGLDVESLWSQGSPSSADLVWMQQPRSRAEARVNNLPMFFSWDHQPSAINSNSLLPEEITKEMKTEDQILAQLRATQNIGQPSQQFLSELQGPPAATPKPEDCYAPKVSATPNMEELHKLIQSDMLTGQSSVTVPEPDNIEPQTVILKTGKLEQSSSESSITKTSSQTKTIAESKTTKQVKEADKSAKNKDNNNTKNKSKKSKDEKKEDVADVKLKDEELVRAEKRSQESSPSKTKKEDKKKDIEKEKKEWIKEGFTIVKGPEKSTSKDNKKKAEEARVADEAERKRKEEEKLATDEEKKKKQAETAKKQQEQQAQQQQLQAADLVVKKAPWSLVANQNMQTTLKEGITLAQIQRLEREKKLEELKEQQHMLHLITQQQAAAFARDQEIQATLGWAKKKSSSQSQGQSLAEIQAEARKQQVATAVAAAAKAMEEAEFMPPLQTNHAPWANPTHNGGGFWDTLLPNTSKAEKQLESQKSSEPTKAKKKPTLTMPSKKDVSPAIEFESWCTGVLSSWSSKIDVPTFVGFLKDIESPYEVKDYVKCYLGESKESSDFSRQFLERRSKLLRVGMVTPSDDLCSPAIAVNPRTVSGSDYQEVKGKGKKTKKNKMLKVDVRILGFSVTAAEDRINVGDIDTV